MEFSRFEKDILQYIKKTYSNAALNQQIDNLILLKREYTGCGFFLDLTVPDSIPELDSAVFPKSPIDGPTIQADGVEYDGGSILFHKNGKVELLEIYAHGNTFPEKLKVYRLI